MRFHLGSFPESADFIPDASWRAFEDQEQSIWIWQLKAFPIAIINMGVIMLIWIILTPVEGILRDISFPLPLKGFLICFISVLIVHELIYAALHPMAGCSPRSILGFWPSRMFLYATYDGDITRNRYLAILLMPFIMISIIPIFVAAIGQVLNVWVVYITILNAYLAGGDIFSTSTILKLPPNTIIRNHGSNAYWKEKVDRD